MYSKKYTLILFIFLSLFLIDCKRGIADDRPETLRAYFQSFASGTSNKNYHSRVGGNDIVKDSWISPDKGYHIVGSMICTTLVGQLSLRAFETTQKNSQIIGAGVSFSLGVIKEVRDSTKPNNLFSWKDLAANGVGIVIGILLLGID